MTAASPSMEATAPMRKSASSVKSPMETTRSAAAREPSPAKIMIEPAVMVMPEHIAIGPPVAPVEGGTVIIVVIRPVPIRPTVIGAIVAATATCQDSKEQQGYPEPPRAT